MASCLSIRFQACLMFSSLEISVCIWLLFVCAHKGDKLYYTLAAHVCVYVYTCCRAQWALGSTSVCFCDRKWLNKHPFKSLGFFFFKSKQPEGVTLNFSLAWDKCVKEELTSQLFVFLVLPVWVHCCAWWGIGSDTSESTTWYHDIFHLWSQQDCLNPRHKGFHSTGTLPRYCMSHTMDTKVSPFFAVW